MKEIKTENEILKKEQKTWFNSPDIIWLEISFLCG